MSPAYQPLTALDALELYFVENRSRLLDIAAFLDRVERYPGAEAAKEDFRYQAFKKALELLDSSPGNRAEAIQQLFSDPTTEPLDSAVGLKAFGAWDGGKR